MLYFRLQKQAKNKTKDRKARLNGLYEDESGLIFGVFKTDIYGRFIFCSYILCHIFRLHSTLDICVKHADHKKSKEIFSSCCILLYLLVAVVGLLIIL